MTLIYPMFAMFLVTMATLLVMFLVRVDAVRTGKVKVGYFKTYSISAPDAVLRTERHYANLFELPVLFYVACLIAMVRNLDGGLLAAFAWLFVIARVFHAIIHMGPNRLLWRMAAFAVGIIAVSGMWISIMLGLLVA
jgi:hypothetical protein